MTALVSLLFITMIPTDCKITNFCLLLRFACLLFCNNYNIGKLITSAISKERMIIFTGTTPINWWKVYMSVSFLTVHTRSVAQHYRQRRAWKVYIYFFLLAIVWKYRKYTCDRCTPQNQLVTVKRQIPFISSVV